MEFTKIQIGKKNTLNVTYKENGNIVSVAGGNLVHKDMKAAFNALIPHIALMTEQREVVGRDLKSVEADKIQDGNSQSVFKWLTCDGITIGNDGNDISITGHRILQTGDVIKIATPSVTIGNEEKYKYTNELSLCVEAIIFEAKAYLTEEKWGIKEGNLDFANEDPFEGKVTADQVPEAGEKPAKEKKTKKTNKAA